jgi:ABC-2 type transport system ATP-binding protein
VRAAAVDFPPAAFSARFTGLHIDFSLLRAYVTAFQSGLFCRRTQGLGFAIEVNGLHKTFVSGWVRRRRQEALRGVDLAVPQGALWGILGPNGAGKTTLLSILSNLVTPDAGEVRVLGKDIRSQAADILPRINLSSGHANFLWGLNVRENLEYYAMLYGMPGRVRRQKVAELIELLELQDFAATRFDELSSGTKQKLSLAKALINDPELLFLDEPTVALDPDVAVRIRKFLQFLHDEKQTTILMTTHNMPEAEILCQQIAFLREGTIRAFGKPPELKQQLKLGDTILIHFNGLKLAVSFENLPGIYECELKNSTCRLMVDSHRQRLPQILEVFARCRAGVDDIQIRESDLEDVFITLAK